MIRSRENRNRRFRRKTPRSVTRDREETLRVLVRILARRAARERFDREIAVQRETSPEVTVQ